MRAGGSPPKERIRLSQRPRINTRLTSSQGITYDRSIRWDVETMRHSGEMEWPSSQYTIPEAERSNIGRTQK